MDKLERTEHIKGLSRRFRKNPTETEKIVWDLLKNKKLKDLKFRRQHPIGRYIVDFYCPKHKLIVEIDGLIHEMQDQKDYDEARQEDLESSGHIFIRVRTEDIKEDSRIIYRKIEMFLKTIDM